MKSVVRQPPFAAEPVSQVDLTSPWITARPEALDSLRILIDQSNYHAHEGSNTVGAKRVYWVEQMHVRPDGRTVVRNYTEGARRRVAQVNADVEAELLYLLSRGRDVQKCRAASSINIVMVQDPAAGRGIDEGIMQRQFPRTFA